ncbi:translation initiation factor IF-2-like [Hyaena hyaena]|uniref:translation initiation factor IF-2-like n=1 Tax=Hyaena hyaena TaxID=95912 RepID=UPI00192442F1|nr:translation initiation factor IF-2-like [Hyaena hyaena]
MRQEQEAPRERRGHPGGRRGRGRPRGWGAGEVPPGGGARRDAGGGWGAASLPLSPRAPGAPAPPPSPAARSAPAAGSGGAAAAGSPPLTLALTPRPLAHTRSHSLTHSLSHTLKQKGSAAQQPVPPQREEEGGSPRNTATAVAKTSRRLGLPPGLPAAGSAAPGRPRRGPHLEDSGEEAGWPRPEAAARRTTWIVLTAASEPDYNAQNAQAVAVAAPSTAPPPAAVVRERCIMGFVVQREVLTHRS